MRRRLNQDRQAPRPDRNHPMALATPFVVSLVSLRHQQPSLLHSFRLDYINLVTQEVKYPRILGANILLRAINRNTFRPRLSFMGSLVQVVSGNRGL